MACNKTETWMTTVVSNEDADNALVLAESIRRTRSNRMMSVIITRGLSMEKRFLLQKVFDAVFIMDDILDKGNVDLEAKLYAFSLRFFEKIVVLSNTCLFVENGDKVFEDKMAFKSIVTKDSCGLDLSMFAFQPSIQIWEYIRKKGASIKETDIGDWLWNQEAILKIGTIKEDTIAKFSVANGLLNKDIIHAPIIQMVDVTDRNRLPGELMALKDLPFNSQVIVSTWLEIHSKAMEFITHLEFSPGLRSGLDETKFINEPVAIIGMSCRYPGANNLDEFWKLLFNGEEAGRTPPSFRWTKQHSVRYSQQARKTHAGFLVSPVDEFDARFFGVSPKEAIFMDPQSRLLHEVVWEALEDSAIDPLSLHGSHTGIFTGSWLNDYGEIVRGSNETEFFRTYMGNSIGAAAARLSFLLGVTGPSIATESGCSSAIVATDLAVKSLRRGETNLAVVGGVNLILHPFTSNMIDQVISPDGRCKTFDAKANGFGRAEGCGVVVLKRMSDALRDRDNIWALIRGSAVSQEGLSRSMGTPTVHCEALAMQLALEDANVRPGAVSFVETHGTGTAVGDPMEVSAITKAYFSRERKNPLVIGSVKTNVGHTESCSGMTGIMKTVLAMQNEIIPKHRNLDTLNPEIFLDAIPAVIPMENTPWPKVAGEPRIAGVSSFGITGTDGHVILQEAPDYELPIFDTRLERTKHLLKLSGKTNEALADLVTQLEKMLAGNAQKKGSNKNEFNLANFAYTANVGRANFKHRAFIVASNLEEALQNIQTGNVFRGEVQDGDSRQICFLFTGQGSQYHGMAKTLYETNPVFRIHFDACERSLRNLYGLSIRDILWDSDPSSTEVNRTIYSQTSIFCVEYCLFKLWESWGISPDYVLGHSLGEFAAAVAADLLEFEDALKLVVERSRLIDELPRGSMLVIKADEQEVKKLLIEGNSTSEIAAVNNPDQTVVAGDTSDINAFLAFIKSKGMKGTILAATHAFHSRHMDPMLEKYRKVAQSITYKFGHANIQFISGMEGSLIADSTEITADYWVRHTRQKVSFIDACKQLRDVGCTDYLEVGPQPVLSSFVMMNSNGGPMPCFPSLRRGSNDWQTILESLGKLYLLGYKVNWKGFDKPYIRSKVPVPLHPFNRKSYWVELTGGDINNIHPLVGHLIENASATHIFQNDVTIKAEPYLRDHHIGDRVIFPGACFTEMMLVAGYCVANSITDTLSFTGRPIQMKNIRIEIPLEIPEDKPTRFQIIVELPSHNSETSSASDNGFQVKVFHQSNTNDETSKWWFHTSSTFIPVAATKQVMSLIQPKRLQGLLSSKETINIDGFYKHAADNGLIFGETFRTAKKILVVQNKAEKFLVDDVLVELQVPDNTSKYLLHPLVLDAMLQATILATYRHCEQKLHVPIRLGQMTLLRQLDEPGESVLCHAWCTGGVYYGVIYTSNLVPVAIFEEIELLETNARSIESVLEQQVRPIPDQWEETWKVIPSPFSTFVQAPNLQEFYENSKAIQEMISVTATTYESAAIFTMREELVYWNIVGALYKLGWKPERGDKEEVKPFCEKFKILPKYNQLVRFYFTVMEKYFLEKNIDESWTVAKSPPLLNQIEESQKSLKKRIGENVYVKVFDTISQSIPGVLLGTQSSLSLLFPGPEKNQEISAESIYYNHPSRPYLKPALEISMSNLLNSSLRSSGPEKIFRVLEVGSGTGWLSGIALDQLKKACGDRFEFWFTDVSPAFFIKAEKKFEDFKDNMRFAVFDLEKNPLGQGIPLNHFDCVVATDVFHATKNLEETLGHIRQTIRPGGVLLFTETISESRDITIVFGLDDGYWRFEDFHLRPHHACIDVERWKQVIENTGFENVSSFKVDNGEMALIIASATPAFEFSRNIAAKSEKQEWILFSDYGWRHETVDMVRVLEIYCGYDVTVVVKEEEDSIYLEHEGIDVQVISNSKDPKAYWDLLGMNGADGTIQVRGIIYGWGMDEDETDQERVALPFFHIAKAFADQKKPPQLFVLTKGVKSVKEDEMIDNPTGSTLVGMMKTLKNENFDSLLRSIDFDKDSTPDVILHELLYELGMSKGSELHRYNVAYRSGVRYEARFFKVAGPSPNDELKLPPSTDRYHLVLPKSRTIQDLEYEVLHPVDLGGNQVEVKVVAYALNFRDIFAILKPSAQFENINGVGLDWAGVVTRTGVDVTELKIGDRVYGANMSNDNQLPSHQIIEPGVLSHFKIPPNMTYWEAATLPAVYMTALYSFMEATQIKRDETVLIHTGSGGVGLAAIRIAQHFGANIITTAGNPRKRAYLRSLGVQHVFHSRTTEYEQDILQATDGRGVDLVLNSLTGPGFKEATLRTCAQNARFIEMSKLSVWTPEEVKALRPDVAYTIVDVTSMTENETKRLSERFQAFNSSGVIQPIPFVKFDALNIRQAFQYFQKAKHIGKVVCVMPEVIKEKGQYRVGVPLFNSNSTYWITGALGPGIGFEVCKWMLSLGATDIILTGRNPPKPEVAKQVAALNERGYNVKVQLGDIGNYEHCEAVLDGIDKGTKPLRGVMHCAGVLRDNLYRNQTWQDIQNSFTPKVEGTWNLHNLTKHLNLEHFVVFSSMTALFGTPAQANHVGANSFEDAFIHYRHSLGYPGTTVNWGQWAQVGVAKEVVFYGVRPVSIKRMLNGLEQALKHQIRQSSFGDFDSFKNLNMLCPVLRTYLDEKLWNQESTESSSDHGLSVDAFWKEVDDKATVDEKIEVMIVYLKVILRSTLRLAATENIGDQTNIQDLGVDSLMMIELKNNIQTILGSRLLLTASTLRNCNTAHLIASAIISKLLDNEDEEDDGEPLPESDLRPLLIDDTFLAENIFPPNPAVRVSLARVVLITGATGRLAPYIIAELSNSFPAIERIICLVRNVKDSNGALEKVAANMATYGLTLDTTKVEAIVGDIVEDKLGLSNDMYKAVCNLVDVIIHCAGTSNYSEHYKKFSKRTDVRSVNVLGTRNILTLAGETKTKHIFFASNIFAGLMRQSPDNTLPDLWLDGGTIEEIILHKLPGFQAAKLVCEMLIRQAVERGFPCKVFRFPWIAGDSKTGCLDPQDNFYILRYLSIVKAKAMESIPLPAIYLPVDICAKLSLKLFFDDAVPCEVFNVVHPAPAVDQEFVQIAKEEFGVDIEIVEQGEFFSRLASSQGADQGPSTVHNDHEYIFRYISEIAFISKGFIDSPDTFFRNKKVAKYIPDFVEIIPPSMDILRKDIRFLKATGVLSQLGL